MRRIQVFVIGDPSLDRHIVFNASMFINGLISGYDVSILPFIMNKFISRNMDNPGDDILDAYSKITLSGCILTQSYSRNMIIGCSIYTLDGKLLYNMGRENGIVSRLYNLNDDTVHMKSVFKKGHKLVKRWFKSGSLHYVRSYDCCTPHGIHRTYMKNGWIKEIDTYEKGILMKTIKYEKGRPVSTMINPSKLVRHA